MIFFIIILEFLAGSLMFSYWLGLIARKNLRLVGDGNPGAANLWKSAGFKYGLTGVALDFLKGYFPLVLFINITGYEMIPIALAPILGHAFSPFVRFKGGKAIAVTFGVWSALTEFKGAIAYALILAVFKVIKKSSSVESDSFQTVFGMLILSVYLYLAHFPAYFLWIWFGNWLILLVKNKKHLILFFKAKFQRQSNDF